ncbi:MAG TPA: AMP-binding protein [Candidatus Limnocylindria bacterium]|nr:AMP-binding protein [Candidatus Limnocylindria bacterium]
MGAWHPTHVNPLAAVYRARGDWRGETIWQVFAATAARHAECVALVDGATRVSFAELATRAEACAGSLAALGTKAGDAVAVHLPNWWETVVALLATARLGAVAVPVPMIARERELRFILQHSGARIAFVPGVVRGHDHAAALAAVRADAPGLVHAIAVRSPGGPGLRPWDDLPAAAPPAPFEDAEAVALLMYTSGSTADPKGVLHTHETLLAEARSLGPVHEIQARDVVLMPSPLTHVSGLLHAVLIPAVHGTRAVLLERWDPAVALELIAREGVTYMVGAPTFLRDLARHPALTPEAVASFRLFSCGGADVDPALVREAARHLGCTVKRVYGSTEFPTATTTGPQDPPERRIDSDGRAIGSAEVRVVDGADRPVAPGVEGEILARGPELFAGYHPAALDADAFADGGWFRTGDLGTLDADGYLRITGRRKDIIIRKGENISAREVEEAIATHPAVAEVAVVGVPDAAAGEIVCAVVRLRAGAEAPSLAALAAHLLAGGLSTRKLPERLEIVTDFPRAPSGKIVKRALRERLTAPDARAASPRGG